MGNGLNARVDEVRAMCDAKGFLRRAQNASGRCWR